MKENLEQKIKNIDPRIIYANIEYDDEDNTYYGKIGFRFVWRNETKQNNGWQSFEAETVDDIIEQVTKIMSTQEEDWTKVLTDDPRQIEINKTVIKTELT
jgi:hypothetical protein